MILTCIGHAQFLLEMANGMRLVTDPYDAGCGYPVMPLEADAYWCHTIITITTRWRASRATAG